MIVVNVCMYVCVCTICMYKSDDIKCICGCGVFLEAFTPTCSFCTRAILMVGAVCLPRIWSARDQSHRL